MMPNHLDDAELPLLQLVSDHRTIQNSEAESGEHSLTYSLPSGRVQHNSDQVLRCFAPCALVGAYCMNLW